MNVRIVIGSETRTVPRGTTVLEVLKNPPGDVVGAFWNNRLVSLHHPLDVNGELVPVDLSGSAGHKIYRRTLCFLLEMALSQALPGLELRIGPSLGDAYFFFPPSGHPLTTQEVARLEAALRKVIHGDFPISPTKLLNHEALDIFTAQGQKDSLSLISQGNRSEVSCIVCEGWYDLEHFPLAPRTGSVPVFELIPHKSGCLLRLPEKTWPLVLGPLEEKPILYSIYQEYKTWGEVLGISNVAELNQVAASPDLKEYIQVAETLQEKKMSALADQISRRQEELKLVLVAGPSSSGKTTFTKKLAIHLRVLGFRPRVISLDDYFVPREMTPRDETGNYDFENLHALDIPQLNKDLLDLFSGREVEVPIFDFKLGNRKEKGKKLTLGSRDILMMEGIHGLNPELTPLIPENKKFRIYISALTQLGLDSHNRISTTDNRLIRRMVRDSQFRGYSALHTLKMWPSVRRGEDKNIFPFQNSADGVFNTALDYELGVLRNYALPLLRSVPPGEPEFYHADRLIGFLENFLPILPQHVPLYSLLREFIGDSGFKY